VREGSATNWRLGEALHTRAGSRSAPGGRLFVTNTVGTVTNYLDIGAATNVPAFYYRVRLSP